MRSGNYAWNSGIFLWSAKTLAGAIREHCPAIAPHLEKIAAAYGTPEFEQVFAEVYPLCQNISIDYAVLEPRSAKGELASEIYCLPADFGWNDLGSWASLHEHQAARPEFSGRTDANVIDSAQDVMIESSAKYLYAPGKMLPFRCFVPGPSSVRSMMPDLTRGAKLPPARCHRDPRHYL